MRGNRLVNNPFAVLADTAEDKNLEAAQTEGKI
jgi:hypothetical protein